MNPLRLFGGPKPKFDVGALLAHFDRLDKQLVAVGFHPTSQWWRAELERFLRSGRRRWVIRAGRRAGKSSFLCRLAVAWALWGPWSVPAGDTAVIPFISVDRDEATARIRTVRDILSAIDIRADIRNDAIELIDRRCQFRVETCSIRSVGFTSILIIADEMARWESRETAVNPAAEVMGSLRPTMATQAIGFEVCSSSVWSSEDYHAGLVELGDTDDQLVSQGTTWECNPTISERMTYGLEPDERIRLREYGNIPGGVLSAALEPADVKVAFEIPRTERTGAAFLCIDASSLRNDSFAWLTGYESADRLCITSVDDVNGAAMRGAKMSDVVARVSRAAQRAGTSIVYGDQREAAALKSLFEQNDIELVTYAWSETSKQAAFSLLRTQLKNRKLSICAHPGLRKQMIACQAHLMPSGRTQYKTNGLDHLSALITLFHAAIEHRVNFEHFPDDTLLVPLATRYFSPLSEQPNDFEETVRSLVPAGCLPVNQHGVIDHAANAAGPAKAWWEGLFS